MSTLQTRKYIRGIFAMGLALLFSDNCLSASVPEERRSEERILSLSIDENQLARIASVSGRRIQRHIDSAVESIAVNDVTKARTHLQAAGELLDAAQMLLPHVSVFEQLQQDGTHLHLLSHLRNHRELEKLRAAYPEAVQSFEEKLSDIYALAATKSSDEISAQIGELLAGLAQQTSYFPIGALRSGLQATEVAMQQTTVDQPLTISRLRQLSDLLATAEHGGLTLIEGKQML